MAVCARFRVSHFEFFERIEDNPGYYKPSVLLVVGGNDIPGFVSGACRTKAFLISIHVLFPESSLGNVCCTEFPVLVFFVDPREEALSLFFFGEVEKELDDAGPVLVEGSFQIRDRTIAVVPDS